MIGTRQSTPFEFWYASKRRILALSNCRGNRDAERCSRTPGGRSVVFSEAMYLDSIAADRQIRSYRERRAGDVRIADDLIDAVTDVIDPDIIVICAGQNSPGECRTKCELRR